MKTLTIIITAILSLQISTLFAGSDCPIDKSSIDNKASYCVSLAPTAPLEATFEDEEMILDLSKYAPSTPKEATFEDESETEGISAELLKSVAPSVPAQADFNDDDTVQSADLGLLAPKAPAEADFTDSF
jgi:hypothetical protein